MPFLNENGIVFHIFSAFFLEGVGCGGGGREAPHFEKNSPHFHLRLGLITFVSFLYSGLRVQRLQLDAFTFLAALW
jgi:hypothetical protein